MCCLAILFNQVTDGLLFLIALLCYYCKRLLVCEKVTLSQSYFQIFIYYFSILLPFSTSYLDLFYKVTMRVVSQLEINCFWLCSFSSSNIIIQYCNDWQSSFLSALAIELADTWACTFLNYSYFAYVFILFGFSFLCLAL